MKSRFLFLLFFSVSTFALAQSKISRLGRFEMDEVQGCAPFNVTIVRTDLVSPLICDGLNPCDINWGDGSPEDHNFFTHTYTQPGTYTLSVLYPNTGFDDIQIVVFPNIQPTFNVYLCSGNAVQVHVTDTNYDSYIIDYDDLTPEVEVPRGSLPVSHTFGSSGPQTIFVRGKNANSADNCTPPAMKDITVATAAPPVPTIDQLVITSSSVIDLEMTTRLNVLYRLEMSVNGGAFSNLGNLLDVSTATVPGLNTDDNFYCFRLGLVNPCAGGSPTYSTVICSADLAVNAANNANNLTWTTSAAGITNFTVNRDGVLLTTTTLTSFIDTDVVCGIEYCYQVITNYAAATSFSTERCVTAISTDIPTAITNVTSVVNGGSVELTWQPDAVFTAESYSVFRQSNGGSFNSLENGVITTTFTDADYQISSQYCYRIDYIDACGNTSDPGISACPVILTYSTNSNNDIILTWTTYSGWAAGVNHYELDKYDLQHTLLETFMVGSAVTYTDADLTDQGYYYVVRAIPNNAINDESVSNEVNAIRSLRFAYPKAFTPDAQGPTENETFKVFVTEEFIASFEMKIFNRWGEMIFSTKDLVKGWNGEFNGQPQPEGTYTFTATLRDKTGKTYKRDGSVVLLRKK
jgi:gliding motility-associated-like protein